MSNQIVFLNQLYDLTSTFWRKLWGGDDPEGVNMKALGRVIYFPRAFSTFIYLSSHKRRKEGVMKRAIVSLIVLLLFLQIDAQAQPYSIMTGAVTGADNRWLTIKSDDGPIVQLRVGYKTVYPNGLPFVGDKVKVEYLVFSEVPVGYSVAILEMRKKEAGDRPPLNPAIPTELGSLVGRWEGFWDNRRDTHFSLNVSILNLQTAEVKYESKDLKFSEPAKIILGDKTRIEWTNERMDDSGASPSSTVTLYSRRYLVWYTCELQKDGTLEAFSHYRYNTPGKSSSRAVMRKMD